MVSVLTREQALKKLEELSGLRAYPAMYSSIYGGIVTDPALMVLPLDDHMVHRGDGIFEAIRSTQNGFYLLQEHLARLEKSAAMIGLAVPTSNIAQIAAELHRVANVERGMLRIFVSRGLGDFSPNPYATSGSQLYMILTASPAAAAEKYEKGARLCFSDVAVKPGAFSKVKSCNYLPNVMMKKEAIDRRYDFAISRTDKRQIAEGPTENILVWLKNGDLVAPKFDYTLRGTTLVRILELARANREQLLRDNLVVAAIDTRDIHEEDLYTAKEVMMVGTTLEVMPVTEIEIQKISNGKVGLLARRLRQMLQQDIERSSVGL